jgi:hypothetical protein
MSNLDFKTIFENFNDALMAAEQAVREQENPLFQIWKRFNGDIYNSNRRFFQMAKGKIYKEHNSSILVRDKIVGKYSWAVPDQNILEKLSKYSPIVEIAAGTGYWANLLAKAGADIVAYDIAPIGKGENHFHDHKDIITQGRSIAEKSFFDVRKGDEQAILNHQDRALFLCWPPYDSTLTEDCLKLYKGNIFIYIGENDGCTSWSNEQDDRSTWKIKEEIEIPQWEGLHDRCWVYERNIHAGSRI